MWRFFLILLPFLVLILPSNVNSNHGLPRNFSLFGIDIVPYKVNLKSIEHCRVPYKKLISEYHAHIQEINGEQYAVGNVTVFEKVTARLIDRIVVYSCAKNKTKKIINHSGMDCCANRLLVDKVYSQFADVVFQPGGRCYVNAGFKEFKMNVNKIAHIWFGNYGPVGCLKLHIEFISTKILAACINLYAETIPA